MADEKPTPKPLTDAEKEKIGTNLHGYTPLHPSMNENVGDTDFSCPTCNELLVQDTNARGIVTIARIDCPGCLQSWRGSDLVPSASQKRSGHSE